MEHALFIACNALALLASFACSLALLPSVSAFERWVLTIAGMPAILMAVLTPLAALGGFSPWPVAATLAVVALAAHAWALRRPAPDPTEASRTTRSGYALGGGILGVAALFVWPIVHRQLLNGTPPHWDDLSYHGPMAAHWLQSGRLRLAPFSYHAYYPGNGELFAAFMMLPSKHDAYSAIAGMYWLVVAGSSVMLLAQTVGAAAGGACFALLAFVACEPFANQASSFAAVDLAGAAAALASVAVALRTSQGDSPRTQLARILFAGCLAGLATGAKITYAPIASVGLIFILVELRLGRSRSLRLAGFFALAALACGGSYYLRNLFLTGNPLFPANLGFPLRGPLESSARNQTTLLYQLRVASHEELSDAVEALLDWPRVLSYVFLAGYALTALQMLAPSTWRNATRRRAAFLLIAGLVVLAVTIPGPFSGTPNSRYAQLQVRLRFFLAFAAFGLPLAAAWLDRYKHVRTFVLLGASAYLASESGMVPAHVLWTAVLGALAGLLAYRMRPLMTRRGLPTLGAIAGCVLIPASVTYAMIYKMPEQERVLRKVNPAWNALDQIPDGSRLTWFATFDHYKYYRAFGPRLRRIPVAVEPDGRPYQFLHGYWRKYHDSWWVSRKRPLQMERLVNNLIDQRIRYVFVVKRHSGNWPKQYEILMRSQGVERLYRRRSHALFEITEPSK